MSQPPAGPYNEEVVSIPVAIVAVPSPTVPSTASGVQAEMPLGANSMRPTESPAPRSRARKSGARYKFTRENLARAPQKTGVYQLYDQGQVIYIGKASGSTATIRSRLQGHYRDDITSKLQEVSHYTRLVVSDPDVTAREMLATYRMVHSQFPTWNAGR